MSENNPTSAPEPESTCSPKPQTPSLPVDISLGRLCRWAAWVILPIAIFSAIPTWLTTGVPGLWAELAAAMIVLTVMWGNGWLVVKAAQKGRRDATVAFLGSILPRVIVCVLATGLVWKLTDLPIQPLAVWMISFYLLCLTLECIWILQAFRRHEKTYNLQPKAKPKAPNGKVRSAWDNNRRDEQ